MVGETHGRERNKRATRRALRLATLELGLEHGLAEVSVDDIAKAAGVSPRTFFNYFDTKDDASLIELFMISDEELSTFATAPSGQGPWADLSQMLADDVDRAEHEDGQNLHRYQQLHARHPALQARQMGQFASALIRLTGAITTRLGEHPPPSVRAQVMAGSCITAVRVGLDEWAAQGWQRPAASYVAEAFAAFDGAFGDSR